MTLLARTLLTALALLLAAGVPAEAAGTGKFIVVYERGVASVGKETAGLERAEGFKSRQRYAHAIKGFSARLDDDQVAALRDDPQVAAVVPDRQVRARGFVPLAAGEPSAPAGIRRIEAAYSLTDEDGVTTPVVHEAASSAVAVLDTGVDLDHPDLNAADGTNCVTPGQPADDDNGHGTHVAGTIGARNQGAGVVGVAPGTRVISVKVLDTDGEGDWSDIICGVDWVTAHAEELGIRVANMSLGGPTDSRSTCSSASDPLHLAVCRLTAADVLTVVAAGNDGQDIGTKPYDVPSSFPEVLTVTAMTDYDGKPGAAGSRPAGCPSATDDRYWASSNYATRAQDTAHVIAAPGVCIRSTLRGGKWGNLTGTSMASPHAAGAAALCVGEDTTADGVVAGPCATQAPAAMIATLRNAAEARYARGDYGFAGDPTRPLLGKFLGHLIAVTLPPGTPVPDPEPAPEPGTDSPEAPAESSSGDDAPEPAAPPAEAPSGQPASDETGNPAADVPVFGPDVTAPVASVQVDRPRLAAVLRRGLPIWVTCLEDCTVTAAPGRAKGSVLAFGETRMILKLSKAQKRRLKRNRRLLVTVTISDTAGNFRVVEKRVKVRR